MASRRKAVEKRHAAKEKTKKEHEKARTTRADRHRAKKD